MVFPFLSILIFTPLIAGLAILFWRYQRKNPGLMSTRSLFLNFEELQKAREQFFASAPPPSPAASGQGDTAPALPVTPEATPAVRKEEPQAIT